MHSMMFYGIFNDVHLVYMWCSIIYFRIFKKHQCDILLNCFLLCVLFFCLMLLL